jgi:hypothetical protein
MSSPYLMIYLLGCLVVLVLLPLKLVLIWVINWITKSNIVIANLKKIGPPETTKEFFVRAGIRLGVLIVEVPLSWINVVVILWQILRLILQSMREILTPVPEVIRALRFPLKNNPEMARESIWAHAVALGVHAGGGQPDVGSLVQSLREVFDNYPTFNTEKALLELEALSVASPAVLASARDFTRLKFSVGASRD